MNLCSVCNIKVTAIRAPGVQCAGSCKLLFHQKCANISSQKFDVIEQKELVWICPKCQKGRKSLIFARTESPKIQDIQKEVASIDEIVDLENMKQKHESEIQNTETHYLLKEIQESLNSNVNILKQMIIEINQKVTVCTKIYNVVEKLSEKVEKLQFHQISNINKSTNNTLSFANIVKQNNKNEVVVIKPKNPEQTIEKTKEEILSTMDPITSQIKQIKPANNGGIIVTCKNNISLTTCKSNIENNFSDKYTINIPKQKVPLMKIVGLSKSYDELEFISKIKAQNDLQENAIIKLIDFKKNERNFNAIIELDKESYSKMEIEKKINIEWERLPVYPYIQITRCFKCQEFHHIAKYCINGEVCGRCAGTDHKTSECNNSFKKCINCIEANKKLKMNLDISHYVWNINCNVYKRKQEIEMKKLIFKD